MKSSSIFVVALACTYINNAIAFGYDYTIVVPPGQKECYYQIISNANIAAEFEYQVLDQSPVNFEIKAPSNDYIVADVSKSQATHPLHLKEVGIYEVCVVNLYSNERKTVYLGLYSDTPDNSWPFTQREAMERETAQAETIMEMSTKEIVKSIDTMTSAAEKMRFLQQSIRMSNVKDYIVQRGNYSRVNMFSGVQLFIMVAASVVQVMTIRHLFTDQSAKSHNMKLAT